MKVFSLYLLSMLMGISLKAEILWNVRSLSLTAAPLDSEIAFSYKFENKGANAVELVQPKPTCVCTIVTLLKTRYEPGERGELNGVYKIKNKQGLNSAAK